MDIDDTKKFIKQNKQKLSLPFNDSVIKFVTDIDEENNVISKKFKDTKYEIFKFYKPITRF